MRLGCEILVEERPELLRRKRIGILAHAASLDASGRHTVQRIRESGVGRVTALFGPEHGLATAAQDMEEVKSSRDPGSGLPVLSLYGADLNSLKPTALQLSEIDFLVVDLQDIGSRYYTYVWTACLCAEACAEAGKGMILCDRPNPIGGELIEGPGIDPGYESFVGLFSLPVRHGMTIGEIVQLVNERQPHVAELEIVRMEGWRRGMSWPETKLAWTDPSPNMRSYTAALLYPGMCLLEGTNVSEGRGTDTPFEIVGAPYVDAEEVVEALSSLDLPGVHAAPTAFIPVRQKWAGRLCHGVRWVVEDPKCFRPHLTGLAFVWTLHRLYRGKGFEWRTAPYEFVAHLPAIDLLTGSSRFREGIESLSREDLALAAETPLQMMEERERAILYP